MPSPSSRVAMSKRHFDAGRMGNPDHRLRIDGVGINYFQLKPVALDNQAIAAGMREQSQVFEVVIVGNSQTDPGVASVLNAQNQFEVSFDNGATFQSVTVIETIRSFGTRWRFRVKL